LTTAEFNKDMDGLMDPSTTIEIYSKFDGGDEIKRI
jgi:hypothetical protein